MWGPAQVDVNGTKNSLYVNSALATYNYWTPLTDQVETLEPEKISNIIHSKCIHPTQAATPRPGKVRRQWNRRNEQRLTKRFERMAVLRRLIEDGSVQPKCWEAAHECVERADIAFAVVDSGATLNCGKVGDPFLQTTVPSGKIFHMPDGNMVPASNQARLPMPNIREPACTVDMVPGLKHNSLLRSSKFADVGYSTVLTPTAVHIYDGDVYQSIPKDAVLRGWRNKPSGLWRIPLKDTTAPAKSEYILLPKDVEEAISNVYELQDCEVPARVCGDPDQVDMAQGH